MIKALSGSTLKIIAIITMLIDHIGAAVLARMIYATGDIEIYNIYLILRKIGRVAFPLFCYLLTEGFVHTSNAKKYAVRLGCFAILSEIPFDLAFQSKVIGWEYQNVFFTLFFGFLAMAGERYAEEHFGHRKGICVLFQIITAGGCMLAAELLRTDYGAMGVICILFLYMLRQKTILQVVVGSLLFIDNWTAIFGFLLILLYNGKRGLKMKYISYLFYPLHLLALYIICYFMGLAGYAAI